jgi:hypothetical protein
MQVTASFYQIEKHLHEVMAGMTFKQMRGKMASALFYLSADKFLDEGIFLYPIGQDTTHFAIGSTEITIEFVKEFEKDNIISQ